MRGVILEGWCDGGPLAGKQLAHYASRYRVSALAESQPNAPDPDETSPRQMHVVEGEYVWDDGAWRWRSFGASVDAD